jgi:hypothetical protein
VNWRMLLEIAKLALSNPRVVALLIAVLPVVLKVAQMVHQRLLDDRAAGKLIKTFDEVTDAQVQSANRARDDAPLAPGDILTDPNNRASGGQG